MTPGPDRTRLRSRSYPGMMAAAAAQWAKTDTLITTEKETK